MLDAGALGFEIPADIDQTVNSSAKAGPAEVRNLVFEGIEWRDPKTLGELTFLPADRELIQLLADGKVDLKQ